MNDPRPAASSTLPPLKRSIVANCWNTRTGSSVESTVTALEGFPTRAEVAARYADRSGLDLSDLPWYVAFAYFKFAAIVAGIVARSAAGAMAGKDTAGYADRIDPCVERGRAALDDGAI